MNITAQADYRLGMVRTLSLSMCILIAQTAAMLHYPGSGLDQGAGSGPMKRGFDDPAQQMEIRDLVYEGTRCKFIPGLALAVVKDGRVLMSEGYGMQDLVRFALVTGDTKFGIASLTKAFTATLLTNLVRGKSDMSRKMSTNIYRILGKDFQFNNTLRSTYATLEDLLAHRMGITRNNYVRLSKNFTYQNFASKMRYLPNKGGFRDSFYYNDLMYGLSAYITEKINGDVPWKQQMRETIFNKLGMDRTTFVDEVDFKQDGVAYPYVWQRGYPARASIPFIKHWGRNYGSGNIVSSANDMAKWMIMLLNKGVGANGQRVLREGVVEQTFSAQNFLAFSSESKYRKPAVPESFTADNYALGWRLGYYRGYQMTYHSGSTFGYRAYLTLLPEANLGVVTLMTGSDSQYKFRKPLHMYLMDIALGKDPWINETNICSYPEAWEFPASKQKRSANTLDDEDLMVDNSEEGDLYSTSHIHRGRETREVASLPLDRYAGTYHNAAYGHLKVTYDANKQALMLEYGIGQWQLNPAGGDEFNGRWQNDFPDIDGTFQFKTSRGKVTALEAVLFDSSKPPVFIKVG